MSELYHVVNTVLFHPLSCLPFLFIPLCVNKRRILVDIKRLVKLLLSLGSLAYHVH